MPVRSYSRAMTGTDPNSTAASAGAGAPLAPTGEPLDLGPVSGATRETIETLVALLGGVRNAVGEPPSWSAKYLQVPLNEVAAFRRLASALKLPMIGAVLARYMDEFADRIVVAGVAPEKAPRWALLDTGGDHPTPIPGQMNVYFPADTILPVPCVASIDDYEWGERGIVYYLRRADQSFGEPLAARFEQEARGKNNPLRGLVLNATVDSGRLAMSTVKASGTSRADVVLPKAVWTELDLFLSTTTTRRELLQRLGLGTSRGLLLTGAPGVGKTSVIRALATELTQRMTIILASSEVVTDYIRELYDDIELLGPTVVVLEDIDLITGRRRGGEVSAPLTEFLNTLDGVRSRQDVLTVATTNDPLALDAAAIRPGRIDTVLEIPKPDRSARADMLRLYLTRIEERSGEQDPGERRRIVGGVDVDAVASAVDDVSGADLHEIVRRTVLEFGQDLTTERMLGVARGGRWKPAAPVGNYL